MSKASRAAKRANKSAESKVVEMPVGDTPVLATSESPASPDVVATEIASDSKAKKVRYNKRTWAPTDIITLHKPMAKGPVTKSKSAARYALYQNGMTVQEYVDAVVKAGLGNKTLASNDLRWDTVPARGHISIAPKA